MAEVTPTPVISEAYVLAEMSADLRAQYDVWLAADAGNGSVLGQIAAAVVLDFRTALLAIPGVVLNADCLTEPCYAYAKTMIYYRLAREMDLVGSGYMATAYCNADTFLRHLREAGAGAEVPIGEGWTAVDVVVPPTPSYVRPAVRPARAID